MNEVERHEEECRVFIAALGIADTARRESFVRRECADERLAKKVLSLLDCTEWVTMPSADAGVPLEAGTIIGSYVIVRLLGAGAFGEVYAAQRTVEFRKYVAIKVVKSDKASPQILARFADEKQILAAMAHPNVVGIHDAGTTPDGRPYFVTEFILGSPITTFCDVERLDIDARLVLFQQVCDGVLHAHQRGIIHRDLKPTNILVSGNGTPATPKIIDFGIAKVLVPDVTEAHLTITGHPIGTALYMSPEQWRNEINGIDTRSDIYSLGVLLHELLVGALPFEREGSSLEPLRRAVLETDAKAPSARLSQLDAETAEQAAKNRGCVSAKSLGGRIHRELDWIVLRCLEKERDRRYPTVADLTSDLVAFRSHRPLSRDTARTVGRLYRIRKTAWRYRGAIGAAALMLAAILFAGLWYRSHDRNLQRRAEGYVQQARMLSYRYPDLAAERLSKARALARRRSDIGVEQAFIDIRRHQLDDAKRQIEAVLAKDPDYGPAIAIMSGLLRGSEDGAQADALEAKARTLLPPNELHYLALGLSDGARAIQLLDKAIDVAPGNTQALWQRAERNYDLGRMDAAIPDATAVVHLTNGLGLAWNLLGATTLKAGTEKRDPAAIRASLPYFDKALAAEAGAPTGVTGLIHGNRAMAYRGLRDLDAALAAVSRAVELDPTDQVAWEMRAGILFDRDGFAGAEAGYSDAIRQFPDNARLYKLRGESRFKHFHLDDAITDFNRAIDLSPESERPALLQLRAFAYRNLGDYVKSQQDAEEALRLRPNWARAESTLAWAVLMQGNVREAHERLSHALATESNSSRLVQHAFMSWLLDDQDTAVSEYEKASETPTFENACFWAWEIEMRRSRRKAAERLLDLAMKRVENATAERRAFIGALIDYARATPRHRVAAEQRVKTLCREESWTLEAEYIFGCVAAANGDPQSSSAWFERCAAHEISDWLDRNLAIARLRVR